VDAAAAGGRRAAGDCSRATRAALPGGRCRGGTLRHAARHFAVLAAMLTRSTTLSCDPFSTRIYYSSCFHAFLYLTYLRPSLLLQVGISSTKNTPALPLTPLPFPLWFLPSFSRYISQNKHI